MKKPKNVIQFGMESKRTGAFIDIEVTWTSEEDLLELLSIIRTFGSDGVWDEYRDCFRYLRRNHKELERRGIYGCQTDHPTEDDWVLNVYAGPYMGS